MKDGLHEHLTAVHVFNDTPEGVMCPLALASP